MFKFLAIASQRNKRVNKPSTISTATTLKKRISPIEPSSIFRTHRRLSITSISTTYCRFLGSEIWTRERLDLRDTDATWVSEALKRLAVWECLKKKSIANGRASALMAWFMTGIAIMMISSVVNKCLMCPSWKKLWIQRNPSTHAFFLSTACLMRSLTGSTIWASWL